MKQPILAYTLTLSTNMWSEKEAPIEYTLRQPLVEMAYTPVIEKDVACFRFLVDMAAKEGYNTILVNLADGLEYQSHPEINLPGAWTKQELKAELAHIRQLGLTPVPMLNVSAAHDVWLKKYAYQVSTPAYYQVCQDLIEEVIELFDKPQVFHLGLDEETHFAQAKHHYSVVRGTQLFAHDAKFFIDVLARHNAKPWMSSDFAIHSVSAFDQAIPHDTPVSQTWVKNYHDTYDMPSIQAFIAVSKLGYPLLPSLSCWKTSDNPKETLEMLRLHTDTRQVVGFIVAPYLLCKEENRYKLMFEILHCKEAILSFREDAFAKNQEV